MRSQSRREVCAQWSAPGSKGNGPGAVEVRPDGPERFGKGEVRLQTRLGSRELMDLAVRVPILRKKAMHLPVPSKCPRFFDPACPRAQFPVIATLLSVLLLLLIVIPATAQQYDPGSGKTLSLIGQTFQQEYLDYIQGTGRTPAGSSHYATFYLGVIEQGDDSPNAQFLDYVRNNNLGEYALVALSIKDNTAAGGYGQMTDNNGANFNPNAIWDALQAINSGQWDSEIDDFATLMANRPDTKFFLRLGYEVSIMLFANQSNRYVIDVVNDYANAGINAFENADTIPEWDLEAYRSAYNYIANRIRNVNGVNNVDFVYHPVRGYWDAYWLYPGNTWVDWVALSVFNNDVCLPVAGTQNCSGQTVDPNLQQVFDWAGGTLGKPLMIAEAAVQGPAADSASGFNDYLNRLHNLIVANDVRVLAYINSDWNAHGWDPAQGLGGFPG